MGIPRYNEAAEGARKANAAEELAQRFGRLNVLDDLIRVRAADEIQEPILAYPKPSENGKTSYEYFTGEDLDCMVDQTVCRLMECGFKPPRKDGDIVALLTLSDLNMVVTFFALSRMGYTVMMLSPRLSAVACVSLLDMVGCETIMYGQTPSIRATMGDILRLKLVACRPIMQRPSREESIEGPAVLLLNTSRNREAQSKNIALILHSSGSTGTPKPLFLSHKALMTHPLRGPGLTSFNSLPWYHLHGLSTALQAMYMRKVAFMWDASLPLTAASVVSALEAAHPESVQGVPYLLQLLVDSTRGLDALRTCKLVTYGGAPCPDDLGDRLVAERVRFGGSFGLTEAGLVAESISRPQGDPYWNYLRFFDNIRQYVWMKPIGDDLYECVYLAGHPALTTSNSDEPAGSYHSRDVFAPHPSLPGRWKYISRLDDRITLMNGEKVLPLPIEGSIKQSPFVQEAVIVGVNKAVPGLLIFRADDARGFSDDEYLQLIWPTVEYANSRAEQFSQITREMICILPNGSICPHTDKGSLIRAKVYTQYADVIENLYTQFDQSAHGTLQIDVQATEDHLMRLCRDELKFPISSVEAEFFTEGIDSLKAIHLRRMVLRDFKIESPESLGQNIVFETGSVSSLAKQIHAIQSGQVAGEEDHICVMENLIKKYSSFRAHAPKSDTSTDSKGVVLTGATGSIGVHTLHRLLNDDTVSAVYCLTRREHPKEAILDALAQKGLTVLAYRTKKIIALKSALDEPDLGLDKSIIEQMRKSVSLVIHTAWPVNFNVPLLGFEPHIKGLHNLIDFSLSVKKPAPAVMLFCSSISTALGSSSPEVGEIPMQNLNSALDMGYGRSKLVGEQIVSKARKSGARVFSLRIGQVSGHSKRGLWNDSEAIPLMIRSALTLKVLPRIDTTCSWIPVDKVACSILEIARACSLNTCENDEDQCSEMTDDSIYNISNSRTFAWSSMLETLRCNGFSFETVSFNEWLQKLRESEAKGEEVVNPAVKLIDHYEAMYASDCPSPSKTFITEKAERDSMTLRNGRLRIVQDGILGRYAQDWLKRWKTA